MKNLLCMGMLSTVALLSGCGAGDNREVTSAPPPASAAGTTDQAKTAAKVGQDNASIEQNIRKTGKLPNGQPIPHSAAEAAQLTGKY